MQLTENLRKSQDPLGDLHEFMHGPHAYQNVDEEEEDSVVISAAFFPKK